MYLMQFLHILYLSNFYARFTDPSSRNQELMWQNFVKFWIALSVTRTYSNPPNHQIDTSVCLFELAEFYTLWQRFPSGEIEVKRSVAGKNNYKTETINQSARYFRSRQISYCVWELFSSSDLICVTAVK